MPQKDTLDRAAYTCMLISYRRLSSQFQFSLSGVTLVYCISMVPPTQHPIQREAKRLDRRPVPKDGGFLRDSPARGVMHKYSICLGYKNYAITRERLLISIRLLSFLFSFLCSVIPFWLLHRPPPYMDVYMRSSLFISTFLFFPLGCHREIESRDPLYPRGRVARFKLGYVISEDL